ncbi:MAG: hypothetical protein AVDCRST_MAG85-2491 [uncultured Solirubrobacteraceae bacterium]|uniref:Saccharopine dehydrogenase NADP binding domain-containing protein n=1 Tax=uncultured Solirubrobacteraceae bacterium TaxID=1162706 RepID=A0A6J4T4Q6_9ACTN|nr:MAG: hypothetical protein AVDCRST_MAG85-2491 [uncultured Solirubrobacteraceae bacterium]
METVVSIVGTGQMTKRAAELLAAGVDGELGLRLLDRDLRAAEQAADRVRRAAPEVRVTAGTVDALDVEACATAVASSDLVVLGAGPFLRTTEPVVRACVRAGVDLLDIGDDAEAAQAALALDAEVAAAGVCVSIGCGASPGLTNVLAADAADALDEVERIDVGWVVGDEGPQELGDAVLQHWVHCVAGSCSTSSWMDLERMDDSTGAACAAFARLALRDRTPGVRAPEDWVTLPELREALDAVRAVPA